MALTSLEDKHLAVILTIVSMVRHGMRVEDGCGKEKDGFLVI